MPKKMDTVRINFNIPRNLLADIDSYAAQLNINRTAAMVVLLSNSIKGDKVMNAYMNLQDLQNTQFTVDQLKL